MRHSNRNRAIPIIPANPALTVGARVDVQGFLTRCFAWMFLGLLLTTGVAAWMSTVDISGYFHDHGWALIAVCVAEIGLVIWLSAGLSRMSTQLAATIFCLYAGINGLVFAAILNYYAPGAIAAAFGVSASMFGGMCVYGYATKRDLDSLGGYLFMGLLGLLAAMLVNIFLASSALYWVISIAGVGLFLGLTAYDMQKLKQFGAEAGGEDAEKGAVFGALMLYLDFINLFLFLLRIFGGARN